MDLYREAKIAPSRLEGSREPFRYAQRVEAGLGRSGLYWAVDHGRLQRPQRGLYLRGRAAADLLERIRTALCVASPHAVVGFHTAAFLYGFGVGTRDPTREVHLLVPAGEPFPQRPGIVAHQVVTPFAPVVEVLGVPCAPPGRVAVDLARLLPRRAALPVLDAALHTMACSSDDLEAELVRHAGLRGVRQARELVPLADGRAECRQESQLRLLLHDARLSGFEPQCGITDATGRVRHRLDLGDPSVRLGIEYDGASHLSRERLHADRARHNWLVTQGWSVRYFTADDLYHRPYALVRTVEEARRSRAKSRDRRSTRGTLP